MTSLAASDVPVEVGTVSLSRPTIEDVFIKLTGRTIREEEVSDRERMRRRGFGPGRGRGPGGH